MEQEIQIWKSKGRDFNSGRSLLYKYAEADYVSVPMRSIIDNGPCPFSEEKLNELLDGLVPVKISEVAHSEKINEKIAVAKSTDPKRINFNKSLDDVENMPPEMIALKVKAKELYAKINQYKGGLFELKNKSGEAASKRSRELAHLTVRARRGVRQIFDKIDSFRRTGVIPGEAPMLLMNVEEVKTMIIAYKTNPHYISVNKNIPQNRDEVDRRMLELDEIKKFLNERFS